MSTPPRVSATNGSRIVVTAVQAAPLVGGHLLDQLGRQIDETMLWYPATRLLVLPELHATGEAAGGARHELEAASEPLDGPFANACSAAARKHGIHLLAGSMVERGPAGQLYNTAQTFSPSGDRTGTYRKIFPWRPSEPFDPGSEFVVVPVDDLLVGLSICYDAWFPEHSRQLAWLGADVICNVVRTTTSDRQQELVVAQANAIVNQVYVVSVNAAGPVGAGRSLVVDPQGRVLAGTPASDPAVLSEVLLRDAVEATRLVGTAGLNRMWEQLQPADAPLWLPAYRGRMDPTMWSPAARRAPGCAL